MKKTAYFFGFSRWKRRYIRPFFSDRELHFTRSLETAIRRGLNPDSEIYIWGKKAYPEVEEYARKRGIELYHVEDGFIRSVSLGSDLTRPYSLVIDSRGIYFDPTQPSDLEHLLESGEFDEALIERARKLKRYLLEKKISKYNIHRDRNIDLPGHQKGQEIILVPGQVEDDASIIYGAGGMSNLELLKQTRRNVPNSYIIYKPHPDVLAGNRKGNIPEDTARRYADVIISDVSLDSVLERADSVHTMTSLVGFEALMRGKKVHTYGIPFYAGWGLTHDNRACERRSTPRSIDELVAAVYLLYPRYIDPETSKRCEAERVIEYIEEEKNRYNSDLLYRVGTDLRNLLSRKIQLIIKIALGE
jgi:capsular polysaccharide export protein